MTYTEQLIDIANQLETYREFINKIKLIDEPSDFKECDDTLFKLQSDIRDIACLIECYE